MRTMHWRDNDDVDSEDSDAYDEGDEDIVRTETWVGMQPFEAGLLLDYEECTLRCSKMISSLG
jgi:hypothetical protein